MFSQKLLMHVKKSGLYSTDGGANGIFQAGEECDRLFVSKYLSGIGVESRRLRL